MYCPECSQEKKYDGVGLCGECYQVFKSELVKTEAVVEDILKAVAMPIPACGECGSIEAKEMRTRIETVVALTKKEKGDEGGHKA